MGIDNLKKDLVRLLDLKGELSKYDTMILFHNNSKDKKNYNPKLVDLYLNKIKELNIEYYSLLQKWF
jgi:hypothetical protein